MGRNHETFKSANTDVLILLGEDVEHAQQYAQILHLPFPVLADPDRVVYHAYGLEKALLFIQRTASVIIDPAGVIRYWKSSTSPITWLEESQELLRAVRQRETLGS